MNDVDIRQSGVAGFITLNRPDALNAVTHDMCIAIEAALDRWRSDASIKHVVLEASGTRAFCAGGDIAELYAKGKAGDYGFGQRFWADEYRLNAKIFNYPKPVISLMQGFTMGGGVGLGCHGSHRIVGDSSQIAMPECGIGLIPDVGGSLILAQAPGRIGAYLGLTASRMAAADAIYAGFADHYVSETHWPAMTAALQNDALDSAIAQWASTPGSSTLQSAKPDIDRLFAKNNLGSIVEDLQTEGSDFANKTLKAMTRNAPLSMAAALEVVDRLRSGTATIEAALELEYRFVYRAMAHGDLLEGIRAAIIDKDKSPRWTFADGAVPAAAVDQMLRPLGHKGLKLEDTT